MAKAMTPAQMRAAVTKWEVQARYFSGWETRGYGVDSIYDAEGIVIHHTGSDSQTDDYLRFLFVGGRPDEGIPAPLCNFSTDMDGDFWVGAAERANHAGRGSTATLNKVKSGNYDWRNVTIKPGADDFTGNGYYYGNEVRFDGGQPMTRAQWITVILSCAAICDFHGWGAWRVIGHKEHTSRKNDPGNTLMYMIRRDVDAALKAGPGNWPLVEDDMAGEGPEILRVLNGFVAAEAARYSDLKDTLTGWMQDREDEREAKDAARDQALAAQLTSFAQSMGTQLTALTQAVNALAAKLPTAPKA